MYQFQVTIKGRTLEELKSAVKNCDYDLSNGNVVHGMEKDLSVVDNCVALKELGKDDGINLGEPIIDEMIEVESPYTAHPSELKAPEGNFAQPRPISTEAGAVNEVSVELDVEGIPWDKRIHAATKTKVKAGMWKTRRGIEINEVFKIKQELIQDLKLAANPPVVPEAPTSNVIVKSPMIPPTLNSVTEVTPALIVTQPTTPTLPTMSNGHSLETFKSGLPMILASLISAGTLKQDYVEQLKAYFQTTEIWNVTEEQKEEMFNSFVQSGLIQKAG